MGSGLFDDDENIPLQTAGLELKACAASAKPESRVFTIKREEEEDEEGEDMGFGLFDDFTPAPSIPTFTEELAVQNEKLSKKESVRDLAAAPTASEEKDESAAGKHLPETFSYLSQINIVKNLFSLSLKGSIMSQLAAAIQKRRSFLTETSSALKKSIDSSPPVIPSVPQTKHAASKIPFPLIVQQQQQQQQQQTISSPSYVPTSPAYSPISPSYSPNVLLDDLSIRDHPTSEIKQSLADSFANAAPSDPIYDSLASFGESARSISPPRLHETIASINNSNDIYATFMPPPPPPPLPPRPQQFQSSLFSFAPVPPPPPPPPPMSSWGSIDSSGSVFGMPAQQPAYSAQPFFTTSTIQPPPAPSFAPAAFSFNGAFGSPQQQSFTFGTTNATPSSTTNLFMAPPVIPSGASLFGQSTGTVATGGISAPPMFGGFGGFQPSTTGAFIPPPPPPIPVNNLNSAINKLQQPVYETLKMATTSTFQAPPAPPPPPVQSDGIIKSLFGKASLSSSTSTTTSTVPAAPTGPQHSIKNSFAYSYASLTEGRSESKESEVTLIDKKLDDNRAQNTFAREASTDSRGGRGRRGGFSSARQPSEHQKSFKAISLNNESDRNRAQSPTSSARYMDVCKSIIIPQLNR